MKTVHLTVRNEEGKEVGRIEGAFADSDLATLRGFLALVGRVNDSSLLARGMPGMSGLRFDEDGFHLTAKPYSNAELHELLHVLRPLILDDEKHSYGRISGLLKRVFRDEQFKKHLRGFQRIYDHGEMSLYMQVTIGDSKLFDKSVLHTWLNGKQYHTDTEKAEAWEKFEQSLSTENARALLIAQLQGKVKALFHLAYLAQLVLNKGNDA